MQQATARMGQVEGVGAHDALRRLPSLLAACLLSLSCASTALAESDPVVVELFTSQNCSHCPEADAFANDLAQRENVLLLSFPVDYWDHLGWKDTLAHPDFTSRQEDHADSLGIRQLYTPQMVVNGESHAVGNRRQAVEQAIQHHGSQSRPLEAKLTLEENQLTLSASLRPADASAKPDLKLKSAKIWLAGYVRKYSISVAAGENSGTQLVYTNVVRKLNSVGMWQGEDLSIVLPLEAHRRGHDGLAVLIQEDATGRIIGAAQLALN